MDNPDQPILRVGAKSHPGYSRTENQDRMGRFATIHGELFLVADGMGGHRGGATAASMTVEDLEANLKEIPIDTPTEEALQAATIKTNLAIYESSHSGDPEISGMGSTLVLALLKDDQVFIGHAGDSRAYLFRSGKLQKLSRDHSIVQQMIDSNIITEEEARHHPSSNIITCAFGQKPALKLEIQDPFKLENGDGILLCSDGLSGYVVHSEIERVIRENTGAQEITDALVDLALAAGGEDNVTIQYLQYGLQPSTSEDSAPLTEAGVTAYTERQPIRWGFVILLALLILLLGLFIANKFGMLPEITELFHRWNY